MNSKTNENRHPSEPLTALADMSRGSDRAPVFKANVDANLTDWTPAFARVTAEG